jgi:site-specific DNA recombinase
MKVAVYCRISKDNLGQDIDRQIHEVREYCKRMDYEVVEEYLDEGFARTTRNRPSLDKLIKDARQKKFKLVVSDELSRFAGTPKLLLDLLEELKVWNVNICSVKEGIDTSSVMGELVATMLSAISKMELFNISHRVKSGISNYKRKNGDVWGRRTNLTDETSTKILENRKLGWGIKKLSKEFSVSHQTIRKVIA